MNSMSRKLLISISTFIFALLAFTGATVAWFNLSDEVAIEGFDMNISTGENLQVKVIRNVEGTWTEVWDNAVTAADIYYLFREQIKVKQGLSEGDAYDVGDLRLEPLTSLDGQTFYNRQLANIFGESLYLNSNYQYNPPTTSHNSTHQYKFFELELTFKSESATTNMKVFLNNGGNESDPEYPFTWLSNTNSAVDMAGAMRMAFIVGGQTSMIYEQDADVIKKNSFNNALLPGNSKVQPKWVLNGWDAGVAVPDSEPIDPETGDRWVDVTNELLFTYGTDAWDTGIAIEITTTPIFGNYYNDVEGKLYTYQAAWDDGVAIAVVKPTSGMAIDDQWFNKVNSRLYTFVGTTHDTGTPIPTTVPGTPTEGDRWYDEIEGKLYTYGVSSWNAGVTIPQATEAPLVGDYFNPDLDLLFRSLTDPWGNGVYVQQTTTFSTYGTYFNPDENKLYTALEKPLPIQTTTSARYDFTSEAEANSFLFELAPEEEKTVTIRIWIEGWDAKTTDELWQNTTELQRQLKVSLNFKGIPQ